MASLVTPFTRIPGYFDTPARNNGVKMLSCLFSPPILLSTHKFIACSNSMCECRRFFADFLDVQIYEEGDIEETTRLSIEATEEAQSSITLSVVGIGEKIHLDLLDENGRRVVIVVNPWDVHEIFIKWSSDIQFDLGEMAIPYRQAHYDDQHAIWLNYHTNEWCALNSLTYSNYEPLPDKDISEDDYSTSLPYQTILPLPNDYICDDDYCTTLPYQTTLLPPNNHISEDDYSPMLPYQTSCTPSVCDLSM
ncbi:hypothetical protein PFISCL1PPCAC_18955 [Pristionchus fissidentatus]|uniref:Uncharacterized protein n=1 Tax=Pristionchus fissidentatus TaxID=1538716 RepID=A0AAV5WB89_9BILA|nr:hypothetical protein PFISCL1PPCAC_18955 [Pristionchus fissidentatus]